jgi:hypothetical protein
MPNLRESTTTPHEIGIGELRDRTCGNRTDSGDFAVGAKKASPGQSAAGEARQFW